MIENPPTKEDLLRPLNSHFTEADRRPYVQLDQKDDQRFLKPLGKEPGHDDTKN